MKTYSSNIHTIIFCASHTFKLQTILEDEQESESLGKILWSDGSAGRTMAQLKTEKYPSECSDRHGLGQNDPFFIFGKNFTQVYNYFEQC